MDGADLEGRPIRVNNADGGDKGGKGGKGKGSGSNSAPLGGGSAFGGRGASAVR
jgi:hypothetical protein